MWARAGNGLRNAKRPSGAVERRRALAFPTAQRPGEAKREDSARGCPHGAIGGLARAETAGANRRCFWLGPHFRRRQILRFFLPARSGHTLSGPRPEIISRLDLPCVRDSPFRCRSNQSDVFGEDSRTVARLGRFPFFQPILNNPARNFQVAGTPLDVPVTAPPSPP